MNFTLYLMFQTTLNNSISSQLSSATSTLLQPRMAQLETLEAKVRVVAIFHKRICSLKSNLFQMASIEVSLSSTSLTPASTGVRRTKRIAPSPTPRIAPSPVSMLSVRSTPTQPTRIEVTQSPSDLESLRNVLSDKENVIQR